MTYNIDKTAERIKKAREDTDLTLGYIAEKCGVKQYQTVSKWEKGNSTPSLENLFKLCDLFNCDLGYLLGEYDCKKRIAEDIHEMTGLSCLAADNLEIAASGPEGGPIDVAIAEANHDNLRNLEIGRIAKIRFLQALLENVDIWEEISVCAYDYMEQMNRYKIDSFHTVDNITHDMFAKVAKEAAKEALSKLFDKFDPVLFEW